MRPKHRAPTCPGNILLMEFLQPNECSTLNVKIKGLSRQTISSIVAGKRRITAKTAIMLSRHFDVTPEFWLNMQMSYDLYVAEKKLGKKRQWTVK